MRSHRRIRRRRSGTILVLTVLMMIGMIAVIAMAVDVGYLAVTNAELQRAADAAAIAAATRLIEAHALPGQSTADLAPVRDVAEQFARMNKVASEHPGISSSDVTIGYLSYPFQSATCFVEDDPAKLNAVKVRIRRTTDQNGEVPLFFAKAFGMASTAMQREATAAFVFDFKGFRPPNDGGNVNILPFALDKETWDSLLSGGGHDEFACEDGEVPHCGHDGVREVNLYPQSTGSQANRGTVDIGPENNSTNDVCTQIIEGISPSDFAALPNGKLEFNCDGKLYLNGDTGLSAAVQKPLNDILGQTRIIPVFTEVLPTNGNNAYYTIVKFVGVRIMYAKLSGNNKRVMVQPANVVVKGGIPGTGTTNSFTYSPVWLVR